MSRQLTVAATRKMLQQSLLAAVTTEDMQDVILMLIERARGGSIAAAKELLDRTLGKPTQEIIVDQQESRSPGEVRTRLAALLIAHPELKDVLNLADDERTIEALPKNEFEEEIKTNPITESPEKYEPDEQN